MTYTISISGNSNTSNLVLNSNNAQILSNDTSNNMSPVDTSNNISTTGHIWSTIAGRYEFRFGGIFSLDNNRVDIYSVWTGEWIFEKSYGLIGQDALNRNVYAAEMHSDWSLLGLAGANYPFPGGAGTMAVSIITIDNSNSLVGVQVGTPPSFASEDFQTLASTTLTDLFVVLGFTVPGQATDIDVSFSRPENGPLISVESPLNPDWIPDLTLPIIPALPGVRSIHHFDNKIYVILKSGMLLVLSTSGQPLGMHTLSENIGRTNSGFRILGLHKKLDGTVVAIVGNTSTSYHGNKEEFLEDTQVRSGAVYAIDTITGNTLWQLTSMPSSGPTVSTEMIRDGQTEITTDLPLLNNHVFDSTTEGTITVFVSISGSVEECTINFASGDVFDISSTYTLNVISGSLAGTQTVVSGENIAPIGNRALVKRYTRSDLSNGVTPVDERQFATWGGAFWQVGMSPVFTHNNTEYVALTLGGGAGKAPRFVVDRIRKKMDPITCELIRVQIASMEHDIEPARINSIRLLTEMRNACVNDPLHHQGPYEQIIDGTTQKTLLDDLINDVSNASVWSKNLQEKAQEFAYFCARLASDPQYMSPYERRILMCGMVVVDVSNGNVAMITRDSQIDTYHYPGYVAIDVSDSLSFTSFAEVFKSTEPWAGQILSYQPGYNGDYAISAKYLDGYLIATSKLNKTIKVLFNPNVQTFTDIDALWTFPENYQSKVVGQFLPIYTTGGVGGTFRNEISNNILYTSTTHFSPADYVINGEKVNKFVSQVVALDLSSMSIKWTFSFDAARGWQSPVYVVNNKIITTDAFGKMYIISITDGSQLQVIDITDAPSVFESRIAHMTNGDIWVFGGAGWSFPRAAHTNHSDWPVELLNTATNVPPNYGLVKLEQQLDGSYSRVSGEFEVLIKNARALYDPIKLDNVIIFYGSTLPSANANIVAFDTSSNQTIWSYPPAL